MNERSRGQLMRSVRLHATEPHLRLERISVPQPASGEVLVRVEGAGVCHSDLHLIDHVADEALLRLPVILGHEVAGFVEAMGPGVNDIVQGEPVAVLPVSGCRACRWCLHGDQELCSDAAIAGATRDGGFAEFILVPARDRLVSLSGLDPAQAAPLADAALTPYRALRRVADSLRHVDATLVVIGIGGLGQYAVQLARLLYDARVIAVDGRPERLQRALELGAAAVIENGDQAVAQVLAATGGQGAAVVLDMVGTSETLELAARTVGTRGTIMLVGIEGGSIPFGFRTLAPEAELTALLSGGNARFLEDVIEFARNGRLHTDVRLYPLERFAEAFDDLRAGRITGRAVLVPSARLPTPRTAEAA